MEYCVNLLKTLVERESFWLRQKADSFLDKKFVIFPAGQTARAFYHTLKENYEIEAEFFIDNNPALKGQNIHGKPIKISPWESMDLSEYAILVPTIPKFNKQIVAQLDGLGYNNYMHADAFCTCMLWKRYNAVASMLADDESRLSYWGAIYMLLTGDNKFIRYSGEQYFSIKEFTRNEFDVIVDAGAFVGDTVEEYVKRGVEGVKIYAFEPFEEALRKLKGRLQRLKNEWPLANEDITIIPAGVAETSGRINFSVANGAMLKPNESGRESEGESIEVFSLDDFFKDKPPFTLLKADIEGGELGMLKGAEKMIKEHRPKMTLSIYHSPFDFARIAEFVHQLVPEYRMYVRTHTGEIRETILYCVI